MGVSGAESRSVKLTGWDG